MHQWGDVGEGERQLCSPLHRFGRKLLDFPQRNVVSFPFPAAQALLGLGSGPSPSSKAEPGGVVVRQSLFQTPLTSRVNRVRFVCNWKHNSHRSVFFTRSVCPQYCRVHRHILIFFFFLLFKLGHPRLDLSYLRELPKISQKMLTRWDFHSISHFIPCCRQCEMMALFPSSLTAAASWFLLIMSFFIHLLSTLAGHPVWLKSVLLHKCRIFCASRYCGLDKTSHSY